MRKLPTDAPSAKDPLIARSPRSLGGAVTAVGAAAAASALASAETAAKELSRAERRRLRRERERERERDDDRENRRQRDRDDDDDDSDRMAALKAKYAAMSNRASDAPRQRTAQQSADENADIDSALIGRTRTRRQEAQDAEESTQAQFAVEPTQVFADEEPEADTAVIRVGSGDTYASIDPETGTATASSNGVTAIAGPDGASIEGTPGETPVLPVDDLPIADGNDDGTEDGGNNIDEGFLS